MNSNTSPRSTRRTIQMRVVVAALIAVIASAVGLAAPATAAPAEVYHSSTINGMWHSGSIQFYSGNTKVDTSIRFNDRAGDAYCTQLKVRAYTSDGGWTTFNHGSVCGGRAGTLSYTTTAAYGTRLTMIKVWTTRADGAINSYVWDFRP